MCSTLKVNLMSSNQWHELHANAYEVGLGEISEPQSLSWVGGK